MEVSWFIGGNMPKRTNNVEVLGTSLTAIERTEDRDKFEKMLKMPL